MWWNESWGLFSIRPRGLIKMPKAQKGSQLVIIDDLYEVVEMDQKTIQKRLNYWFAEDLKNDKKERNEKEETNFNSE